MTSSKQQGIIAKSQIIRFTSHINTSLDSPAKEQCIISQFIRSIDVMGLIKKSKLQ